MDKYIILFLECFPFLLFLGSFMICFITKMIIKPPIKPKNKKQILTNKLIATNFNKINWLSIFVCLIFGIVGNIVIYCGLTKTTILGNQIMAIVIGLGMIITTLFLMIKSLIDLNQTLKGKFVIVIDHLADKEMIVSKTEETHNRYYFYFQDYFKMYNQSMISNHSLYNKSKIGDKFYLVFSKHDEAIFRADEYELENNDNVIKIENLDRYTNITKYKEEINDERIIISKQRIINDYFNKDQKKGLIFDYLIALFFFAFVFLLALLKAPIFVYILIGIVIIFFLVMSVISTKQIYDTISNIKNDNYTIRKDNIVSINDENNFKDANVLISFKLKNYKKIVYAEKKDFYNTEVNDDIYLIFVNKDKDPIKVYNAKNSTLDDNLKIK